MKTCKVLLIALTFSYSNIIAGTYNSSTDFSTTQGTNQWEYLVKPRSSTDNIADAIPLTYNSGNGYWTTSQSSWVRLTNSMMHPDWDKNTILRWIAPANGIANISGIINVEYQGSSCINIGTTEFSVKLNNKLIWKSGERPTGIDSPQNINLYGINLSQGDFVDFEIDSMGNEWCDGTTHFFEISLNSHDGQTESLLWNPGPIWDAFGYLDLSADPQNNCTNNSSAVVNLSERMLDGNEPNIWPYNSDVYCDGQLVAPVSPMWYNGSWHGDDGSQPSVHVVTWGGDYGILNNDNFEQYPGWAVWHTSGGGGVPKSVLFLNNTRNLYSADPCEPAELGWTYHHWAEYQQTHNSGQYSFKQDYVLSDFDEVYALVDLRLDYLGPAPQCTEWPAAYVTVDFRIAYFSTDSHGQFIVDSNGFKQLIRHDLVGVVLANPFGFDGHPETIFLWGNEISDPNHILFHGEKLGYTNLITESTNLHHYKVALKSLINYLPAPPEGCTWDNAIITGLDLYSHTRSADLSFEVTNIDLIGLTRQ